MVQRLVEYGANVNERDDCNKTPLFYACEHNNLSTIQYLIEHNADTETKDMYGRTPIQYASDETKEQIIQYIAERNKSKSSSTKQTESATGQAITEVDNFIQRQRLERTTGARQRVQSLGKKANEIDFS